jgi:hypothetical protein
MIPAQWPEIPVYEHSKNKAHRKRLYAIVRKRIALKKIKIVLTVITGHTEAYHLELSHQ